MSYSVLLRYQELALKGKNRPWFQRHLVQHVRKALAGLSVREIRVPMGRLEAVLGREASADEIRERLRYVFGLANYSLATRVPCEVPRRSKPACSATCPRRRRRASG